MKASASAGLRIKGNYFGDPFYFRTDVTTGVCRTPSGVRICALTQDFLLGLLNSITFECGRASAAVLKSLGRRWGQQFIKRLDKEMTAFYQHPFTQLPHTLILVILDEAFAAHGYGRIKQGSCDTPELFTIEVLNSIIPTLLPDRERPSDFIMAGFLSALFSYIRNVHLEAIQTECTSCGHDRCRFVVGPADRISDLEAWFDSRSPVPAHEEVLQYYLSQTTASNGKSGSSSQDETDISKVGVSQ